MKKKLFLIFITLITIIIINPLKVNAEEGPIMWIDCPVGTKTLDNGNLEQTPYSQWSFVRLTENNKSKWYFYNGNTLTEIEECWAKTVDKANFNCNTRTNYNTTEMLNNGKCPTGINTYYLQSSDAARYGTYLVGETSATNIVRLTKKEYYFIGVGKTSYIYRGYYYDKNGLLQVIRPSVEERESKEKIITDYQKKAIENGASLNFFKFDAIDNKTIFQDVDRFYNDDSNIIEFGSSVNHDKITDSVAKWYENNSNNVRGSVEAYSFRNNNQKLLNTCKAFNEKNANGETYNFGSYSAEELLKDLSNAKDTLSNFLNNSLTLCSDTSVKAKAYNSATNCVIYDLFSNAIYGGVGNDSLNYYVINEINNNTTLYQYIYQDVSDILLKDYNILDEVDGMEDILVTLGTSVAYLNKYAEEYNLNKEETSALRAEYEKLLDKAGINIIVDCESLFGENLINQIKSYLNIIKIAIPLILITFGVVDFAKAVFSSSEDEMKKAQKDFVKRLEIAILIFFIPTIVHLILLIANKVWVYISPDSCGLF